MSASQRAADRGGLSASEIGGLALSYALVFVIGAVVGFMVASSAAGGGATGGATSASRADRSAPTADSRGGMGRDAGQAERDATDSAAVPRTRQAQSGPTPEQIKRLRARAKANPKSVEAQVALGNALFDAKRYEEAIAVYGRALELKPKQPDVLVDRGICYRRTGSPKKAAKAFERAIEIDPDHANAHFNLGLVASHDLGDRKRGIKAWQRYLEIAPNSPHADRVRRAIKILKRRAE